ncbi:ABC transporter permease subunit [Streptomyces sp. TLI_105]|uniref:ABC transporter permease subunit n=1 Tax=Streptomyces sp. TLI_105 TaxID=1881019 RepID=UPI00089CB963|nr:ABC transporter permease subunit [Streptomyces sp. TLI_105]SEC89182.1 ABC-2 family transporter protein [Streptomyces sp. TLI_105]
MSALALRGPHWVTARQHRRALWLTVAAVAVSLAVIGGLRVWDMSKDAELPDRWGRGYDLLRAAMAQFSQGMLALPLLVGAFVAGPLIAREFESGTYKLSLTQSITPVTWLRTKLLTATAASLATTLALTAVYLIGWQRVSGTYGLHWAERGPYEATGTVLASYVLLAIAVGALVGQLVRRTLVAMAATGGVVGLVMLALGAVRWDFLPVRTITGRAHEGVYALQAPGSGLLVEQGLISTDGQRLPGYFCYDTDVPDGSCRPDEAIGVQYLDYHPFAHFWPTQLIESGILLALAALATYAAFRVLRARLPQRRPGRRA